MSIQNIKQTINIPVNYLVDEATRNDGTAFSAWKTEKGLTEDQDAVEFELTLGGIIFDLYVQNAPKPASPLAVKKAEAELLSLAQALTQDEFELSEKVLATIKTPLADDEVFKTTSVNASYDTANGKQSMALYAGIIYSLQNILNALVALYPQEA